MRLILVRHGQTYSNVSGLLDTDDPGADLTDLGRQQAAAVPEALAGEAIEVVYASTLVRTHQTAEPLTGALAADLRVRDEAREIRAGELEMRGDEASRRTYLETVLGWAQGNLRGRMPGGESGAEVLDRYDSVIEEIEALGVRTAVLVTHGAVMRAWTAARASNVTAEFSAANPVTNTGAIVLDGSSRTGWTVDRWQDHALGGVRVAAPSVDGPAGARA